MCPPSHAGFGKIRAASKEEAMDPLALDPETMRRLGYRAVDMLVERLTDASAPPIRRATPAELAARLGGPPAPGPESFEAILEQLGTDVLPFATRGDHPGFFAFIPFSATWSGALGDLIASACNIYAGSWMESAGPSQVELEVLGWFKQWLGYPPGAEGLLVSGGSAANMTALACARETLVGAMRDDVVVYVSDQGHSSLARAARHLGFRPEQVRVLPVDDEYRLRPERVEAAISADERRGRRPLVVCANAGTTNTGAVDPRQSWPRSAAGARSGSTSTPHTAASPSSRDAAAPPWPGSPRPTRSRSTRRSGCTSPTRAGACSCGTGRRSSRRSRSDPTTFAIRLRAGARWTSPTGACS
jgi:Pyridoxal-dependent decarboxylase conserved domain